MARPLFAILASVALAAPLQGEIVYSPGALPQLPPEISPAYNNIDFDGDGRAEVVFPPGEFVCVGPFRTVFCHIPLLVTPTGANELLMGWYYSTVQLSGAVIGEAPPTDAFWSSRNLGSLLADQSLTFPAANANGGAPFVRGWNGPLAEVGVGYLGARFYQADGLHYGWVRVRLGFPMAVDCAYETQTNTPVAAGAIGSSSGSLQFSADLESQDGTPVPPGSYCTFILTGDTLRCELSLAGAFSFAEIRGPAPPHSHAKPVASLDSPLVSGPDRSAFFADVTLSRSQLNHLRHGALYVSVDGGRIVGRIPPVEEAKKGKR